MKGIILAGGSGTRLYPVTKAISKQLLPIYDKPMIYYPLSTLLLMDIQEILIISTPRDIDSFKLLLGDGSQYGVSFSYEVQENPNGLAEAFIIGESFIGDDSVALILGDNIFYGSGLTGLLQEAIQKHSGATIFGYYVDQPHRYGVVDFDEKGAVKAIVEKPQNPPSHYAVPGLYIFDCDVVDKAKALKPSKRGELEIADLNNLYIHQDGLSLRVMPRGMAWLDTGTYTSLMEAGNFVETIQNRQGLYIAAIEEIAYQKGYINEDALIKLAEPMKQTAYGRYLMGLVERGRGGGHY